MTRQASLGDLTDGGFEAPAPDRSRRTAEAHHGGHSTREMHTSPRHTDEAEVVTWCSDCRDVVGRRPA